MGNGFTGNGGLKRDPTGGLTTLVPVAGMPNRGEAGFTDSTGGGFWSVGVRIPEIFFSGQVAEW